MPETLMEAYEILRREAASPGTHSPDAVLRAVVLYLASELAAMDAT